MICPNCSTANEAGRKFCLECGTPLNTGCPNCGAQNPPNAKFCGECGTNLGSGNGAGSVAASARCAASLYLVPHLSAGS